MVITVKEGENLMVYIIHIYIILIIYILFGRNKDTENCFTLCSFVYVVYIFGQRWMTGVDFPYYLKYYLQDFTRSEWGYFGLQVFLKNNNLYFGLLIFIVFVLTQFNFYRFFKKFDNYSLLIFVFLISEIFFAQMSQMRQYVAISFFVNSYYYANKKEYPRSMLNLFFAYSFHSSAIYFFPFLFIKIPYTKNIVSLLLTSFLMLPLVDIRFVLNLPFLNRYSGYLGGNFDVPLGINHSIKYLIMLVIFIFYIINLNEFKKTKLNLLIINGLIFYMLIYGLSLQFAPLYRIATYFQVFEIVFLVHYSKSLKGIPTSITNKTVSFLFIGLFIFASISDSYRVSEYQFRSIRLHENRTEEQLNNEIIQITQ